jgi:hypothetical protein
VDGEHEGRRPLFGTNGLAVVDAEENADDEVDERRVVVDSLDEVGLSPEVMFI